MKRILGVLIASLLLYNCGGGSTSSTSSTSTPTTQPVSVALSPSAQTSLDQGQTVALTATVSNDSGSKGVAWTVSGTGCSGAACGTLTNTTTAAATYNTPTSVTSSLTVTVTATSVSDPTKSAESKVVVNPPPTITTTSLASGTVGTAYNATLGATGGTGTLTWSLATGSSLPAGLNLGGSGTISGSPTAPGSTSFTVKLTDSASTAISVSTPLSITINYSSGGMSIGPTTLPNGTAGVSYTEPLTASGGTPPYTWSLASGSTLPAGLSLINSSLAGTPTVAGTFNFSLRVMDSASHSVSQALALTLSPASTSGTVAQGLAISGATVTLKDSSGNTATTTTAGDGTYSLNTTGFIPPYLVQVQIPSGGSLYSVSADNGMSTTINVQPYTDLLVRSYYGSQGQTADAAFATQSPSAPGPSTVQLLQNQVTGLAQLWLTQAGVNSPQLNMISGAFVANGSGLDQVLDWTTVNTSNLTVTITDGTTTQTSTITLSPSSSTVTVTSTTTNGNGTSTSTSSAVVPGGAAQQTALSGIVATVNALNATVTAAGGQLSAAEILPYFAADFINDGLTSAQYAAQLVATNQAKISGQIQKISALDTVNGKADIVFASTRTLNGVTSINTQECWFELASGTWLLSGDGQIAAIDLKSETRSYQGVNANPSNDGPTIDAGVSAPQGTVTGATITGGNIWPSAAALSQAATYVSQGMNFDQFFALVPPLTPATFPAPGTPFTFAITPTSGQVVSYSLPSTAFTTEQISITYPTNSSLAGVNLGEPLQVAWNLPTTYPIAQVSVSPNAYTGDPGNPSSLMCNGSKSPIASNATSTIVTIPATCSGQAVTWVQVGVTVLGLEGESSDAIMQFANTGGGGGGSSLIVSTPYLPSGTANSPYSATLAASGGVSPYTWSTTGSFPSCLSLNSNSGEITGTPTSSCTGTFRFTAMVTDSTTPTPLTAAEPLSITINSASTFNITTTSVQNGTTGTPYTATLQTSGGTLPILWNVSSGSLPPGLHLTGSSTSSGTISGTPTQPGSYLFTATATDSSSGQLTSSQSFTITVAAGTLQINNNSLPGGFLTQTYSQTLSYSGGTPPVSWSWTAANSSSLPPGLSLSTSGAISGTPSATGTYNVTVTASDLSSPTPQTAQQSYSITVAASSCGTGNEALLSGQYAFSLSGYNQNGFVGWVGSFVADGAGHFTTGATDTNSGSTGALNGSINTSASSYTLGTDNRGCATIVTSYGGTLTTRFVVGSVSSSVATSGSIIEFDTPNSSSSYIASGQIQQQTTGDFTGGLSSNYVFGWSGWDFQASAPVASAGVMNASGNQITNFELDQNDSGTLTNYAVGAITGTYTNFDSTYGRATASFTSSNGPFSAVLYMVSASKVLFLEASGSPIVLGQLQQQTVPSGGFTSSSINGNIVLYANGADGSAAEDSFMGLVKNISGSTFDISIYGDNGSGNANNGTGWQSLESPMTFTCSYSVAANGRMTLSGSDPACAGSPVFYLTSGNTGLLVGQGSSPDFGAIEPQANITFDSGALSGPFFTGPLGVVSQSQETDIDEVTLGSGGGHIG